MLYHSTMVKVFASLLVVISLLFPLVAQAADVLTVDDCEIMSTLHDDVGTSSHEDDADGKPLHHHCCTHSITPAIAGASTAFSVVVDASHILADEALSSLAFGPPLKPPSHV